MTTETPETAEAATPPRQEMAEELRTRVAGLLTASRARSTALTDAVDDADLVRQHSPLMSPLVWDLAHIGNQEELWLVRDVGGRAPLRPEIDELYDAFQHPRSSRVELPLLTPSETRAYVAEVRDKALDALGAQPAGRATAGGRGLRVRHDRPARAAARRDDAGHPPAPRGRARAERATAAAAGASCRSGTCSCPRARSRWAPPPSRGRWTTSGPRTPSTCPPSGSTPCPSPTASTRRSSTPAATTTPAGGPRRAGGTGSPPTSARRSSGPATAGGTWWRRRFGVVEPVPLDEPVVHVCCARGRRVRGVGGGAAAHRGRVGEGGPLRPGHRRLPPLPLGRRRPRTPCTPTSASATCCPRRSAPTRRARRRWACTSSSATCGSGRRRAGTPTRASRRSRTGSTPRCSSAATTGCCAAAPSAPTPPRCRGTFRNWDHPVRRQIFAGFRLRLGRVSARVPPPGLPRATDDAVGARAGRPSHGLLRQSYAPADMRGGGTVNADGFGVGWYPAGGTVSRPGALPAARRRSGPTRRSPSWPRVTSTAAALAAVRSATVGMPVTAGASAPVRRGPLAVQPQRRGPRLAGRRGGARGHAAGAPTCSRSTPRPTAALLWALVRAPAPRGRRTPADALAGRGRRGRGGGAGLAAEPAAHRRHDGRGHGVGPRPVGAHDRPTRRSSPPSRSTTTPAGPASPTDTCVVRHRPGGCHLTPLGGAP